MDQDDNTESPLKQDFGSPVPTSPPGITSIWDTLVDQLGERFVEVCYETLPSPENGSGNTIESRRYDRYHVAYTFVHEDIELAAIRGRSKREARLQQAYKRIAKERNVDKNTIRQNCVRPYDPEKKTEAFLDDLDRIETILEKERSQ